MFVTDGTGDALEELEAALSSLGVPVTIDEARLVVDSRPVAVDLIERAHPNPAELRELVAQHPPGIVVADRLSEAGRDILRSAGWGWLDRRGHLRMWWPGLRIEAPVDTGAPVPRSGSPWTEVGLEVALHCLCHPDEPAKARRIAAVLGRSSGAVHELIKRFTDRGLIGPNTLRPLLPDLFWETAAHWPDDGWLGVPLGLGEVASRVAPTSLIRVDERAATLGGARIAAAGDLPARCYVTDPSAFRKLRNLEDQAARPKTYLRRPPVRWLPELDGFSPTPEHPWRIGHPILVALRLAQDPSRGREIVENWGLMAPADS